MTTWRISETQEHRPRRPRYSVVYGRPSLSDILSNRSRSQAQSNIEKTSKKPHNTRFPLDTFVDLKSQDVFAAPAEMPDRPRSQPEGAPPFSGAGGYRSAVYDLLREHQVPVGVLALYVLTGMALRIDLPSDLLVPPAGMISYFLFFLTVYLVYRWWERVRTGMGIVRAWVSLGTPEIIVRMIGGAAVGFWLHLVTLRTFLQWKSRIPMMHPYTWDEWFAAVDRTLHFGLDPWELLHPLLGRPLLTVFLDKVYVAWFAVLTLVVLWQVFSSNRVKRWQFLTTYMFSWILIGTLMGTVLSSVGPIFYEDIVGDPGSYEPLLSYLERVDAQYTLQALQLREVLWQNYIDGGVAGVGGIAAMPSLHVGLSILFVLVARHRYPALAWLLFTFAMLVFLATIHLGWHYAIDGYVAAVAILAIWWVTGKASLRYNASGITPD